MLQEHTASFSGAVQDVSSLLLQNTGIYMPTHVTICQQNKMCLFCECGHIKAHLLCGQPGHLCPSAPVLNSKLLYTAATGVNRLTPNDSYMGRTTPLTSKRCILYIYSTNVGTEYFKRALYSPFFSLQNAVCFIMLTCLVPTLFTFYIQGVLKLKK